VQRQAAQFTTHHPQRQGKLPGRFSTRPAHHTPSQLQVILDKWLSLLCQHSLPIALPLRVVGEQSLH
jgi:hypothetical protein